MAVSSELVNTILARTREGKLTWEELSSTGFLTRVGHTMIVIDRPRNDRLPVMRVTDELGKVLEIVEGPLHLENAALPIELLTDLYDAARRQALKVNETLLELKRKLDAL